MSGTFQFESICAKDQNKNRGPGPQPLPSSLVSSGGHLFIFSLTVDGKGGGV